MFNFKKTFEELLLGFTYNSKKRLFYKVLSDKLGMIVIDMQKSYWAKDFSIHIRLLPMYQFALGYDYDFNLFQYLDEIETAKQSDGFLATLLGLPKNKIAWWSSEEDSSTEIVKKTFLENYSCINDISNLPNLILTIKMFSKKQSSTYNEDREEVPGNKIPLACAYAKIAEYEKALNTISQFSLDFPNCLEAQTLHELLLNQDYGMLNQFLDNLEKETWVQVEQKYFKK